MKKNGIYSILIGASIFLNIFSTIPHALAKEIEEPQTELFNDVNNGKENPSIGEFVDNDFTVPSYSESDIIAPFNDTLPSSYDSRDLSLITPVKNQGAYNTGWAFAVANASETSMIKQKYDTKDLDLSELHFAYFFYNRQVDPLGGTQGDQTKVKGETNYLDNGGKVKYSTIALANWQGMAKEETAPYDNETKEVDASLAYDNYSHLQEATWISMKDTEIVKSKVKEYGTAIVEYYDDDNYRSNDEKSYYYYNTEDLKNPNLTVSIVGWNDDYDKTNFKNPPINDGAWLIKDSRGSDFGDNGYFWISYEDSSLISGDAYFLTFEPANNYDNNYQYDGSSGAKPRRPSTGRKQGHLANIFQSNSEETLEAVSFYTWNLDTNYEIQVYKNLTDTTSPLNGTKVYDIPINGNYPYLGYHTVELPESIHLDSGELYSVVVKLSTSDYYLYVGMDYSYSDDGINFTSKSLAGQSFYDFSENEFKDVANVYENTNVRVKAFTNEIPKSPDNIQCILNNNHHIVSWDSVDNAKYYEIKVYEGNNLIKSETTTENQYQFLTENDKTYTYEVTPFKETSKKTISGHSAKVTEDSQKNITTYKIHYSLNGGTNHTSNPSTYTSASKSISLLSPTRNGYTFDGWYTDSGFNNKITEIQAGTTGDITLYAKWTQIPAAKTITVTFNINGGSKVTQNSKTVTVGNTYGTLPTAVRSGYTFKGWYTKKTGGNKIASSTKVTSGSNHTLYAQWTANKIKVTFNKNGGSSVKQKSKTVTIGNTYGSLPTAGRKGYTLKGWYTKKTKGTKITNKTKVTVKSNQTLYAQWTKVTKPKKPTISSLKNSKSKQLNVVIKKVSGASGYEILYSTNAKFKSAKKVQSTSLKKTIKSSSLKKGKTYYVKVRAYKLDSMKKKIYGSYGKVRKIKLKK